MSYAIQELVVRDVAPVETGEITELLAVAMGDGPVARWLSPNASIRRRYAPAYFEIFAEHATRYGEVYATVDTYTGEMSGVALWFPFTSVIPSPDGYDRRVKEADPSAFDRVRALDDALDTHHPLVPHHYLAFLAVRPSHQGRGIGSALIDRHHRRLDAAGIPAYLEANDPRNRDLYLRHGYVSHAAIRLPDGPQIWPMWRAPMP